MNKKKQTEKIDFHALGKDIYDAVTRVYADVPFPVIIPIPVGDGIVRVKIDSPVTYVQSRTGKKRNEFRSGVLNSDGSIAWSKWE